MDRQKRPSEKFNQNSQQADQRGELYSAKDHLLEKKTSWLLKKRKGGKSIWDWLDLLIVPILIATTAGTFTLINVSRQIEISRQLNKIYKQRDKDEKNRNQRNLLVEYMDEISGLVEQKLLNLDDDNSTTQRTIAKARTISILRALDSDRKGELIQFLSTAQLIEADNQVVDLFSANLTNANLKASILRKADLNGTLLFRSNLWGANLIEADLSKAILVKADLEDATLEKANLEKTDLEEANLNRTNLNKANFIGAINIVPVQIKSACNWEQAKFTEGFKQKLAQEPDRKVDCSRWN
ncbi:hypothetical protein C7B62_07675 [Pleurocapsa sp. CCALA 161]|uniref:pentapeptide repeat-containing protein n=1 Tax=Pleurocapsa sp. CCALA 161 TaxID=2107688 RepID=UPI000D054E29|nr:pentapeptide repeat-containing protein [Pleurocapsa sp. CCALA 161]PSB10900.1 hypothetical protein C7B62_07675 [Pleurocapsa sp. CCALA 161]